MRSSRLKTLKIEKHMFYIPALLLFLFYIFIPAVMQIGLSLVDWKEGILPTSHITLDNYLRIFKNSFDPMQASFLNSLKNNSIFLLLSILFADTTAFIIAFLFSYRIMGKLVIPRANIFFRSVYFLPTLISTMVIGFIWTFILSYYGTLNRILDILNLSFLKADWLADTRFALLWLAIVNSWQWFGFITLIFFAGFQAISNELIDASEIDGANVIHKLRYIYIPLLAPSITIILIMNVVGCFKIFDLPFVMTHSGPGFATDLVSTLIIREDMQYSRYGYGNALSTLFFIFMFLLTVVLLKFFLLREERSR